MGKTFNLSSILNPLNSSIKQNQKQPQLHKHAQAKQQNEREGKEKKRKEKDLIELLGNGSADDTSVKSSNINGNQRRKGFRSSIGIDHIPEKRFFPFGEEIVGVLPP